MFLASFRRWRKRSFPSIILLIRLHGLGVILRASKKRDEIDVSLALFAQEISLL
jgi:hypothetical protein